ncbi:MAG: 50S ribosomal protein L15 [Candidatus Gracilibacteria bacterium]|nr:50S ribosomal protein L15 [Candidatus Gracilibacteria bacterium]
MVLLNTLRPNTGARNKSKRLGRGNGSGKGTFCGKGCKGQNARSGGGVPAWFEGGQTPLFRRMPKLKGFSNAMFKTEYNIVNLDDLELLASKGITEITKEVLLANKVIRNKSAGLKVLGNGDLTSKVTIKTDKISDAAKEKIEKVGGKVELITA